MIDIINLTLKITLLLIVGSTAQVALSKRLWGVSIFAFAVWVSVFKTSIIRAAAMYVGVFGHEDRVLVDLIRTSMMSSWLSSLGDLLMLIAGIGLYIFVSTYRFKFKGGEKK